MRIKIIGENNCARATRHLLRLAGFAVTEFLPAEVVTAAPHSGYAITIESFSRAPGGAQASSSWAASTAQTSIPWAASTAHTRLAPARLPLTPSSKPDSSTHGPTAVHEEAPALPGGASSPAFFVAALGGDTKTEQAEACSTKTGREGAGDGESGRAEDSDGKSRQAEVEDPGPVGTCPTGVIYFDSVEGELERAILRHVTQLAAAPVLVDRPGGVVHSERELRIVLPETGDARAEEAAAVAVEFGVLRGLLDLTRRPSHGELRGEAEEKTLQVSAEAGTVGETRETRGVGKSGKRWWIFGGVLLAIAIALFGAGLQASPRVRGDSDRKTAQAEVEDPGPVGTYATQAGPAMQWGAGGAGFSLWNLGRSDAEPARECGVPDNFGPNQNPQAEACATGGAAVIARRGAVVGKSAQADGSLPFTARAFVTGGAEGRGVRNAVLRAAFAAGPALPQGQFGTGQAVRIFDGANTLVVDPCQAQAKLFVSINQTGNTQLVAGTSSKKIYICSMHVVVAAATSVALVEGTGTVCGTGTAGVSGFGGATAATGWNFMANGGIALGNGQAAVGAEVTSADNLCLFNSGSGQVSGGIGYVVQ